MPSPCFALWQAGLRHGLGQIATKTHFFVVRHKSCDRLAVLQKHKSDVLIVSPINTIGKIACCLCPPIGAASRLVYEVLMYPQKPPFDLPRNYLLNHS